MKSLKGILITLVAAGALLFVAAPARAAAFPPVPAGASDSMSLFNAGGVLLEQANAFEADELAKNSGPLGPLYFFDTFSNPAAVGHYIAVVDSAGVISDVIGVTSILAPVFPTAFAFLSDATETGLSPALIAADGFLFLDGTVQEGANGVFLDSLTNPFMASYINPATLPGGRLTFFSDGIPDGGSAVALLGIALTGIEVLRRKLRA